MTTNFRFPKEQEQMIYRQLSTRNFAVAEWSSYSLYQGGLRDLDFICAIEK